MRSELKGTKGVAREGDQGPKSSDSHTSSVVSAAGGKGKFDELGRYALNDKTSNESRLFILNEWANRTRKRRCSEETKHAYNIVELLLWCQQQQDKVEREQSPKLFAAKLNASLGLHRCGGACHCNELQECHDVCSVDVLSNPTVCLALAEITIWDSVPALSD